MKTILILLLLMPSVTFAESYVSESGMAALHAGQPYTVYTTMGGCNSAEPDRCYPLEGKDLNRHSPQDIQVDDPSKPLYGPKLNSLSGLPNLVTCQAAQPGYCDALDPGYPVQALCADELPASTYEVYCIATEPQSYQQMAVKYLLPDAALAAAADAADAAKAQAAADKATAKANVNAAGLNTPLTLPAMQAILKDLIDSQK